MNGMSSKLLNLPIVDEVKEIQCILPLHYSGYIVVTYGAILAIIILVFTHGVVSIH